MTVLVKERHSGVSHYNPQTGRFLSEDPIGFEGGDANLYRYVFNRPLTFTDPYGKNAFAIAQGVGFILEGLVVAIAGSQSAGSCQDDGAVAQTEILAAASIEELLDRFPAKSENECRENLDKIRKEVCFKLPFGSVKRAKCLNLSLQYYQRCKQRVGAN